MRRTLTLLTTGALLLGTGLVGAQTVQGPGEQPVQRMGQRGAGPQAHDRSGPGSGPREGFRPAGAMAGLFRLPEGTTVTATFYDGDPQEGAGVLETLTITIGQDSERSFAEAFRNTLQEAAYLVLNTSETSRTVELPDVPDEAARPGRAGMRGLPLLGLDEGSTVTAGFYDGDPAAGATLLRTLAFVAGQDSEIAFRNDFREAAADSAYVVVTTSPQEHTVDLSRMRQRAEEGPGPRGMGPGRTGPRGFGPRAR